MTLPWLNREYRYTENRYTEVLPRTFYYNVCRANEYGWYYQEYRYTEDR